MARQTTKTAQEVETFNPENMTVEQLLVLLQTKAGNKSLVEVEQEVHDNKIKALKAAFYLALNVEAVNAAMGQFKVIKLSLNSENVVQVEYGVSIPVTVLAEKGQRVFTTHLIVNDATGAFQYAIKGNYDKQFVEVLMTDITECKGKTEQYVREYFKNNKDQVCKQLNTIDPVRFQLPAA